MRRSEVETEWGAYGDTEGAIEVEYGAYEEISAILPCEVNRGNLKVIGEWLPPNPPLLRNSPSCDLWEETRAVLVAPAPEYTRASVPAVLGV